MKYKILPLIVAAVIALISLLLTYIVSDTLLSQLSFELFVTSIAYFILIFSLHLLSPKKIDPEKIFLSGLARPPYLNPEEVYVFKLFRKSTGKSSEKN